MKLLILIVVMVLERSWRALALWCADRFVEKKVIELRDNLARVLGHTIALGLLLIVLPLVLAWIVALLGSSLLGGLIYFLISIAVLLLLLAPRQSHKEVKALQEACVEEDAKVVAACRVKLTEDTPLDAQTATTQQLAERIITLGYNEWFVVLFWFVVLGPAGALFYRLLDWFAHASAEEPNLSAKPNALGRLQAVLDWPLVRIYAALLLMAGGFNRGFDAWMNGGYEEPNQSLADKNAALIGRVGHASLELEHEDDCAEGEVCLADQSRWYKNAGAIVLRALLIGLAVVAVLTLSGWLR